MTTIDVALTAANRVLAVAVRVVVPLILGYPLRYIVNVNTSVGYIDGGAV